ncbi:DUF6473 family protein [Sphingobium sp. AN558]|uniref:DUF6473 family protein n=1 Tax=Sphingobium sp. AN558 TaxID=3133442 RepID=UPI0030C414C7
MVNYAFNPEDHPDEWSLDYSKRDHEIVDYQYYELEGIPGIQFRGPPLADDVLASGNYFTCLGGAQANGIFVERTFGDILSDRIGLPVLNLSVGGGGAGFYLQAPGLLDLVNKGRFTIVQAMTARTEPNSRYGPYGFVEALLDLKTGQQISTMEAWTHVFNNEPENAPKYVAESLDNWVSRYRELAEKIRVPKILFYFSDKDLNTPVDFSASDMLSILGKFPQFVDAPSMDKVRPLFDAYVECRSMRNYGYPLVSRFTGEPVEVDGGTMAAYAKGMKWSTNHYYPSPEMHEDAADALAEAVPDLNWQK